MLHRQVSQNSNLKVLLQYDMLKVINVLFQCYFFYEIWARDHQDMAQSQNQAL